MSKSKLGKFCFSIIVSPFIIAAVISTLQFIGLAFKNLKITFPFFLGFIIYIPLHNKFRGNSYLYVLSHELNHAIAAIASGVRVKGIRVRKKSGFVNLSQTNAWISLAPYFVPLYAIIFVLIYSILNAIYAISEYRNIAVLIIGFLMSFHLINTGEILSGPVQSDIKKAGGFLFSAAIAIFLNSIFLIVILKFLFPDIISLKNYAVCVLIKTKEILKLLMQVTSYIYNTVKYIILSQ